MARHVFALWLGLAVLGITANRAWTQEQAPPGGASPVQSAVTVAELGKHIRVLKLATAQRIALAGSPTLAAARSRVAQARARVRQARSAYWPRLDLTGSGARTDLPANIFEQIQIPGSRTGSLTTFDDPQSNYSASLAASWTVFDGFARRFSNAAARFAEQQSRQALNEARRLLLSAVADSYFSAQLARENVAIARADEAFNQRQVEDAQARYTAGTGSMSDILNFKIQVNASKSLRYGQQRAYETALHGLAALMGISGAGLPAGVRLAALEKETPQEMLLPATETILQYAYRHRPDILQAEYGIQAAQSNEKVAGSEYYPRLDLLGSLDGQRTNSARFEADDFGNTVALSLSYNLFAGGSTRAKVWEAKSRTMESQKKLQELKLTAADDVQKALADLKRAQAELRLQRTNTALVNQNRDLIEKEYKAGQASLVRLNEAQRNLITAQARLALALVSLRQAWHNLEVASARILAGFGRP